MKKNKENGVQMPWNEPEFIEAWSEWLQYRKERKLSAYTPTGLKRTFNGLVRDSGNNLGHAVAMIYQAMEKSWQGIYPLKNNYNVSKQPITTDGLKDAINKHIEGWK